ncbi:hypothetical protein MARHY1576 [Marinobacter nauticus ATCC 49840]|nr:hypothetical protein MARHY1576 [Marinobacter nauticus ATCC 49840]
MQLFEDFSVELVNFDKRFLGIGHFLSLI